MIRKNFIGVLAIMLSLFSCAKSGAEGSSTTNSNMNTTNNKVRIDISEVMWQLDDKTTVPAYVYNKTMPGQTIRVKQGDRVQVSGKNALPLRTSIHWHGLEVPISQDGTMTSFDAGEDFEYDFIAKHPGTYWYHTHTRPVSEQVDMGLSAPFIIEDPIDALYNGDFTVMIDDIFLGDDGKRVAGGSGVGHLEKLGNNIAINGKINNAIVPLHASATGIYKVRFINPSSNAFYEVKNDKDFLITHMDGSPLPTAQRKNSFKMGPGERVDVEFRSMSDGAFPFTFTLMDKFYNGKTYGVSAKLPVIVSGTVNQDKDRIYKDTPLVLPADFSALASKKPEYEIALNSRMKGMGMSGDNGGMKGMKGMDHSNMKGMKGMGNMAGMDHGNMDMSSNSGSMLDMMEWTMNGNIFPNIPPILMKKGTYIKVRMSNNDMHPMDHPMHLHGTKFMVLSVNGKPYLGGEFGDVMLKDVISVPSNGYVDILFTIDEIGKWMFHCHILDHEDKGMMMTIDVSE